ncbi:FadR/GntR family transcriptional regulator [Bacillus sp. FJAT-52991]|uniref:FadR/GntR family transcriptional regulator n=1 Tax=Bacillus kandeliae TaxID=3129297 RepID=A0ABZ2N7U2_9BACI
MNISKIKRVSLVDQVISQMEALIESGEWQVGDRIAPELELMEQFAVSRNTLREAIRSLVHAGLLQTRQGSGTFVCSSSVLEVALHRRIQQSNLLEILEVRHALEREAAQLAAARRSKKDLEQLKTYLSACQEAAKSKDHEAYTEADIQLHKAIAEATHNHLLIDLYDHMTVSLQDSVHHLVEINSCLETQLHIHSQLVDAIINQDREQAMAAVNDYMTQFKIDTEKLS